jgi:membrane protein
MAEGGAEGKGKGVAATGPPLHGFISGTARAGPTFKTMSQPSQKGAASVMTLAAVGLAFFAGRRTAAREARPVRAVTPGRRELERRVAPARASEPGRGRDADRPGEIPARGWKDILIRTGKEFLEDQAPLVAAGVTFYSLLALFPGIGAFVALWGLFGDVAEAQRDLQALTAVLPGGAITVIGDQMAKVAAANEGGLSLAALGGFLVSLWSANGATKAIIAGVGIAYDEEDERGFLAKTLTSLAFTLGFLVFAIAAAGVLVAQTTVDAVTGPAGAVIFGAVAWTGLFAALVAGLAVLYRYGPSRDRARWRWISWGSLAAGLLWLATSVGFSLYAANFGSYDKTYGALGAVVGFLTWIWISAMVVLLGAELNSEIEHQTARDSTVGPPEPLGSRGATMADTVGEAQVR